jgi:hypothetical protein
LPNFLFYLKTRQKIQLLNGPSVVFNFFSLLVYGKPQQRVVPIKTKVVVMKTSGGDGGIALACDGCLNYVQPFINVNWMGGGNCFSAAK